MAISLSIQPIGQPPEKAREVPIATMSVFDQYWMPVARTLALQWVPRFRTGTPLRQEDVTSVVQELSAIRKSVEVSAGEDRNVILPRLDRLVTELQSVGAGVDLYIG